MPTAFDLSQTPILSQAYAVGQGFDVFDRLALDSLLGPLFAYGEAGTQVFTFLGKDYLIPDFIAPVASTRTYYQNGTYETRESFQNKIAASAGVETGFGAFSGEMQASFDAEFDRNAEYFFGFQDFYSQLATLYLGDGTPYLTPTFKHRLESLPDTVTPETLDAFNSFFNDFGAYVTRGVTLGAALQFRVAVSKESSLTTAQANAMLEAQYKALFISGKVSGSVEGSIEWKSYAAASSTTIVAVGGDPALAARLAGLDPMAPSQESVALFSEWVDSATSDPAVVDFALEGIWLLAGSKRAALEEAWEVYGQEMHPRLTIKTTGGAIYYPVTKTPEPPTIICNEIIRPPQPPTSPAGWQVVVFPGGKAPSNQSALLDKYYELPTDQPFTPVYLDLYEDIVQDLSDPAISKAGNILVMSTYWCDLNMPPTNSAVMLMELAGAGTPLQEWLDQAAPGSGAQVPGCWIGASVCYILVGVFGDGPQTGIGKSVITKYGTTADIEAELDIYLYRESFGGRYTLGPA